MNITLDELFKGKPTCIKGKNYFSTQRYVQPFLEKMSAFTNDFKIMAKLPDQMTINDVPDVTFNKVLIQAKLDNKVEDLNENIFMVYGLDVRKPIVKFYRGYTDEDNNLFIDNPMFLSIQELQPEEGFAYNVKSLMELTDNTAQFISNLKTTMIPLTSESLNGLFGALLRNSINLEYKTDFGKVKLSTSLVTDLYKLLFLDRESKYYITSDQTECSLYTIYSAAASILNEDTKDIMNKFEKSILINQLFNS